MSKESNNSIFKTIIEGLLSGKVLCEYSATSEYEHLNDEVNRQEADDFLRKIGRSLRVTGDGSGYYAAYNELSDPVARLHVKHQFNEAINDLEPMINWLKITSTTNHSGSPLKPGDTLRGSELLKAIETAPALVEQLDRLSRSGLFANKSTGAKKQLDAILKRLCDNNYLIARGSSGSVYIATGKWARLYEILEYIAGHEQLDSEEDSSEQKELVY